MRNLNPTTFDQVFYTLSLIFLNTFTLYYTYFVYKTRDHQPIKARLPWLVLLLPICSIITTNTAMFTAVLTPGYINCAAYILTMSCFAQVWILIILIRIFLCIIAFQYSHRIRLLKRSSGVQQAIAAPLWKRPWVLWIHKVFSAKGVGLILLVLLPVAMLPFLVFSVLLPAMWSTTYLDPECIGITHYVTDHYTKPMGIVWTFSVLVCIWKIRKVHENYQLRKEFLILATAAVYRVGFFYLIRFPVIFDVLINGTLNWIPFLGGVVPFVVNQYAILVMPYRESQRWLSAAKVSVISNKTKNGAQILLEMLNDPLGFEMLREFAVGEFSVENLLFWKETEEFYTKFSEIDAETTARRIFNTYIAQDSPLWVNINYEARHALNVQNVHRELFRQAQEEIFALICSDTFKRFKFRNGIDEYKTRAKKQLVTENGPIAVKLGLA